MNKKSFIIPLAMAILFGSGVVIGLVWHAVTNRPSAAGPGSAESVQRQTPQNRGPSGRRILYWVSPMNPKQRFDHPGKDSMGMEDMPVYAPTPGSTAPVQELTVSPRMVQTLGVRLVAVQPRRMGHAIHTVGIVSVDGNDRFNINLRVSGWVTNLRVRAVGDTVRRGQLLATLYSPELYAAQNEYLIARRERRFAGKTAIEYAALEKLELLGMTRAQIAALDARGRAQKLTPVLSPAAGTVLALGARTGSYITPNTVLFKLADLRRVWVRLPFYSYQLPWVGLGNPVHLRLANDPAKTWNTRVSFLYPALNTASRTVEGRASLDNPAGLLRPGMFMDATVLGTPRMALVVPTGAVLRSAGGDYVMVAEGRGHFIPVEVALGPESGGWVEIRRGLEKGEQVVTSAQFLLYSESQVQEINARLLGPTTPLPEKKPKMLTLPGVRSHGAQA